MTPSRSLAEIVEEGERLEAVEIEGIPHAARLEQLRRHARFRDAHFATLLAVAKAAVMWDAAENDNMAPHPDEVCKMGPGDCAACDAVERRFQRVLVARTTLCAAVRGDAEKEG